MQSLQKELPVDKINPEKFTPASLAKFAQTRNFGDLVPRDKLEFVGRRRVNPHDPANANRAIPNPNKPFAMDASGISCPTAPIRDYEIRKASAGAARTNVNVDAGPKAFWSDFGKNATDVLFKEREGAQAAASTVQSIAQIRSAAAERGAYQGTGADAKLTASKALGALGMPYDAKTVANTGFSTRQPISLCWTRSRRWVLTHPMLTASSSKKTVPRIGTDPAPLPPVAGFHGAAGGPSRSAPSTRKSNRCKGQQGASFLPFSLEVPQPQPQQTQRPSAPKDNGNAIKVR